MSEVVRVNLELYVIDAIQTELFAEEFFGKLLTLTGISPQTTKVEIEFEDADSALLFKKTLNNTYKKRKDEC